MAMIGATKARGIAIPDGRNLVAAVKPNLDDYDRGWSFTPNVPNVPKPAAMLACSTTPRPS